MMFEVAHVDDKVYLTFKEPSLVRKFMGCIEDLAKQEIFNGNYEKCCSLLDGYLALEDVYKEITKEDEKIDTL